MEGQCHGQKSGEHPTDTEASRAWDRRKPFLPWGGKTEEDTLFLRQLEPGGEAARGSRVTDTQLVSEKQQE